jgi:4-alpha-glucanotransferase
MEVERERFKQYIFFDQWESLKARCERHHIRLMGDMPIYVSLDSCDVWAHPQFFDLDDNLLPIHVAGAPPDYFSKKGQLWGNPVYDWERMAASGFSWWLDRFRHNGMIYHAVRLDHFRGFVAFWQVPAGSKTARNGVWRPCPGKQLLQLVQEKLPHLDLVAEDLGHITPDVRELMVSLGFPGMKILQFAFGDDLPNNPYLPHNIDENCVVYTGTHDNNTLRGWYAKELSLEQQALVAEYLGTDKVYHAVHEALIRAAMMSRARVCMLPLQDVLDLGSEARMNTPSQRNGNWVWRVLPEQLPRELAGKLARWTWLYGRQGDRQQPVATD